MAEERRLNSDTKLIIGFVVGSLTIGLVVFLLLKALRETLAGLGGATNAQGQPINIYNVSGQQGPLSFPAQIQPSALANRMELGDGTSLSTKTDTVTLSTSSASRVFTAPRKGPVWSVRIHVLGPAGSFASFAVDSTPDPDGGQSMVVPAGGHTILRIGARQSISGIASGKDTQVSYVASCEVV